MMLMVAIAMIGLEQGEALVSKKKERERERDRDRDRSRNCH